MSHAYFTLLVTYEATVPGLNHISFPGNTCRFWHFFWQALEEGLRFAGELARCVWGERQGNGPSLYVFDCGADRNANILSHFLFSLSIFIVFTLCVWVYCLHVCLGTICAYVEFMSHLGLELETVVVLHHLGTRD